MDIHYKFDDREAKCRQSGFKDWTILIPLSIFPMRALLEGLLILLRPPLDFEIWIKRGLIPLYLCAICMLWLRFCVDYYAENNKENSYIQENMAWFDKLNLWSGVAFVCLISVSQSFILFKLSQLVYILPEKYRWNMVAAQASGGIFTAAFDSVVRGLWSLTRIESASDTWPNLVNIVSTLCFFAFYIFSFFISWKEVK